VRFLRPCRLALQYIHVSLPHLPHIFALRARVSDALSRVVTGWHDADVGFDVVLRDGWIPVVDTENAIAQHKANSGAEDAQENDERCGEHGFMFLI